MSYDFLNANVSIHVAATGGGSRIQQALWSTPGSSSYFSGSTFPYSREEQEEFLGFMPEHFCSEEAAIDLASAAYMKAFRFGNNNPIGVGLTASVASTTPHKGEHRFYLSIITNDKVKVKEVILPKGIGEERRATDDLICLNETILQLSSFVKNSDSEDMRDATDLAFSRFMKRPFFAMNGKRSESISLNRFAIMSGAYNPPHIGHFNLANTFQNSYGDRVIFEVSAISPHKAPLSVQDLLKRAKLLNGYDRYFSTNIPFFIDKARAFPNTKFIMGADAAQRLIDPKWGVDIPSSLEEFFKLGTTFFVNGRLINDTFTNVDDIIKMIPVNKHKYQVLFKPLHGRWDISSSQIRDLNK